MQDHLYGKTGIKEAVTTPPPYGHVFLQGLQKNRTPDVNCVTPTTPVKVTAPLILSFTGQGKF